MNKKKNKVSGLAIAAIIIAVVIFNGVVIFLDLKNNKKKDGLVTGKTTEKTTEIVTEEPDTTTEVTTEVTTEATTTEEPTTEEQHDMLKGIREEFPEYSVEEQEKVLYIYQNMHLYSTTLINILHKNHETLDFVYNYPEDHLKAVDNDISAEVWEAKNGIIPLFLQWDKRWGYMELGDGIMANNGCGPTCLSMVVTYLTKSKDYSPAVMAKYAMDEEYYVDGHGTAWSMMSSGCEDFGVRAYELGLSELSMAEALEKGDPIIACVSEGDFTDGGHFIVITGYKDGQFSVNDPYSVINTQKKWDYNRLAPQISGLWAFYRDLSLSTEDFNSEESLETTEETTGQ